MGGENHFKLIKHDHLHHLVHPRLDQLVHKLIWEVTPAYYARICILDDDYRLGRPKSLSPYQKAFKAEWNRLAGLSLGTAHIYDTNIPKWTCNCGQQKYSAFCLCKHLVQGVKAQYVEAIDPRFFTEIRRRRTVPIYWHPVLTPITRIEPEDFDSGTVTDGDDHIWSGSKAALKNGGWRSLSARGHTLLGKRRRVEDSTVSSKGTPSQSDVSSEGTPSQREDDSPGHDVNMDADQGAPEIIEPDNDPAEEEAVSYSG